MCYLAVVSRAGYYRQLAQAAPDEAEMALRAALTAEPALRLRLRRALPSARVQPV
jgi:hypothetical protein